MSEVVSYELVDNIAVISIDSPPVNGRLGRSAYLRRTNFHRWCRHYRI